MAGSTATGKIEIADFCDHFARPSAGMDPNVNRNSQWQRSWGLLREHAVTGAVAYLGFQAGNISRVGVQGFL